MKKYFYDCDGGSLLIGNADFACHYMNNFGDGCHTLTVFELEDDPVDYSKSYEFVGSICGEFNVYDYDCLTAEERTDNKRVLCSLRGRYGIYAERHGGDMMLVYWDDCGC